MPPTLQESNSSERVPLLRSIQTKFVLTYIFLIVAVLILLNTYPLLVSQDLVFQSKKASLQSQASSIANALALSVTLTDDVVQKAMTDLGVDAQVQRAVDGFGSSSMRIMVTDPSGFVLYDTKEAGNAKDSYALLGEVVLALRGYDVYHREFRDAAFRCRVATPVTYRGLTIGAVYLYELDTDQGSLLLGMQSNLRSISIVICMVAMVLSVFFSSALTRRIATLLMAIRIVREGEYSHRIHMKGGDELSHLAREFNQLTGRLQTTEEVRRRFVSDASHELKTPLASIRLLTDSILQTERIGMDTVREFVADIGEEADRLTRISEKLLTLTRLDSSLTVDNVPVDVKGVLEKVEHMLLPLAAECGVTIETELDQDCQVLATGDDLYQIAFNLIENALKYNLPGGRVMVALRGIGDLVILTVEDTGVGIPEEDLQKIFDRFYRVDKARSRAAGGTGLGLSIVRDTARQHNGAVSVRPREPEGTCFEVAFPRWYGREGGI